MGNDPIHQPQYNQPPKSKTPWGAIIAILGCLGLLMFGVFAIFVLAVLIQIGKQAELQDHNRQSSQQH